MSKQSPSEKRRLRTRPCVDAIFESDLPVLAPPIFVGVMNGFQVQQCLDRGGQAPPVWHHAVSSIVDLLNVFFSLFWKAENEPRIKILRQFLIGALGRVQ